MLPWSIWALLAVMFLAICSVAFGKPGDRPPPDRADAYVIQFGASWCPSCRGMRADIAATRRAGYPVVEYDIDEPAEGKIHARFGFTTVPATALVGKDASGKGFLIARHEGTMTAQELRDLCRRHGILPRPAVPKR